MTKYTLLKGLVCTGLFSVADTTFAGTQTVNLPEQPSKEVFSVCKALAQGPVLYENDSTWIRKAKISMYGQFQAGSVSPNGANRFKAGSGGHNDEWRRAYLGGEIQFADGWRLANLTNIGGLEARNSAKNGAWVGGHTKWSLYELYLEKKFSGSKWKLGKVTPRLTSEYSISSSRIKTIERSSICNELIPLSNWALEVQFQKEPKSFFQEYGVYLNANGTDLKDEIQFNSDNNVFAMVSMKWHVSSSMWEEQTLGYQYAHNFTNWRGNSIPSSENYWGTGAQDVISLSWDAKQGKFSVMGNLLAGIGLVGKPGAKNVYGLVLQPVYRISSHIEGVFQYQFATGKNSVRMNPRYIPSVTNYASWVDSMHSFYMGCNYYFCPKSIDSAKLMLGLEYITSHSSKSNAFDGWSITGAFRFRF